MPEPDANVLTPPFIFRVSCQCRLKRLKFSTDLVAMGTDDALNKAKPVFVEAIRPLLASGAFAAGDLLPVYFEIRALQEPMSGEEIGYF